MKSFALCAAICLSAPASAQDDPSVISDSGNEAFFVSPTGNIQCAITAGDGITAECYLHEFTPAPALAARSCGQAWGFFVDHDGVGRVQCSDPSYAFSQRAKVLGYGRWVSFGLITCQSEKSGMTCVNSAGHGFKVARASQSVF